MLKKYLKYSLASLILGLLTYVVAILAISGNLYWEILIKPYAYMMLSQFQLAKSIAFSVGILFLSICFCVSYSKKTNADLVLSVFSYVLPFVGLIIGIVYRVRENNNTSLSNCYLLTAITSIISSTLIFLSFAI